MKFIQSFVYSICLFVALIPLWSCNNESSCKESIASYLIERHPDSTIKDVIVSDKYIATVDSAAISNFMKEDTLTDVENLTKRLKLLVGSDIYFSSLNSGDVSEQQIENIIDNSKSYSYLNLPPQTYCIFSIISVVDKYGDDHYASMAFLINNKDSITSAKFVEPCSAFLQLFDKKEISKLEL